MEGGEANEDSNTEEMEKGVEGEMKGEQEEEVKDREEEHKVISKEKT